MESTATDEGLEQWELAASVSLQQSTGMGVAYQSSTANLELRAGAVVSAVPGWQVQWPVTGSRMTLFVLVLMKGSVLNC